MQGDKQVIDFLNKALLNELMAINQYWLHYRILDNWGIHKLAEYEKHESLDEMRHADTLAERVLFLEGLPNFQALGKLKIGESVEEILKCDLDLEHEAVPLLKEAIAHCEHVRDYVSREIFERMIEGLKSFEVVADPTIDPGGCSIETNASRKRPPAALCPRSSSHAERASGSANCSFPSTVIRGSLTCRSTTSKNASERA